MINIICRACQHLSSAIEGEMTDRNGHNISYEEISCTFRTNWFVIKKTKCSHFLPTKICANCKFYKTTHLSVNITPYPHCVHRNHYYFDCVKNTTKCTPNKVTPNTICNRFEPSLELIFANTNDYLKWFDYRCSTCRYLNKEDKVCSCPEAVWYACHVDPDKDCCRQYLISKNTSKDKFYKRKLMLFMKD